MNSPGHRFPSNRPSKPTTVPQQSSGGGFVVDTNAVVRMSPSLAVRVARTLLSAKSPDKQIQALAYQLQETYRNLAYNEFLDDEEEESSSYYDDNFQDRLEESRF